MKLVLFSSLGAIFILAACQQVPAQAATEEALARAQNLLNEAESMTVVDAEEYVFDSTNTTNMTAHINAFYQRFRNNSVTHDFIIQFPWNPSDNRPAAVFARGIWQNNRMLRAEICLRQEQELSPHCETLGRSNAANQLQEIYIQIEPQIREMFDQRQATPPRRSPHGVTET